MVRLAGTSTRNRNRQLSNRYRLKVIRGDVEADPVDVADEDMATGQYMNLVAGVDAEDANEHHLREVLHASSQHVYFHLPTRGAQSSQPTPQTHSFIPTPDSTGIVEHYSDLYAPNRWKDPVSYLCTSISLDDTCTGALAGDFTYYMDERDKEWLDKNNEAARGEGTNVPVNMSPSVTRRPRSPVTKGDALEPSLTLTISDDEFELVMGLLEKLAHKKTEYMHHGLKNGMTFPAFSEYQDTFSSFLSPASFAAYSVPQWIPAPSRLVSIAGIIYHYWKERRIKRGGHRIIPILNLDDPDTLNESYACFRRRETKTLRKTRASQVTSSDRLIRLQTELLYPLELGKQLLQREQLKRERALHSQQIWNKRILLADFRRKFPGWGDKEDEDLLTDKDRPRRVESFRPPKIKTEVLDVHIRPEHIAIRPTERVARINHAIETVSKRQKEEGRQWEDEVNDPYQVQLVPYSTRCFKYIPLPLASSSDTPKAARVYRALRTRIGRGGRFLFDRRNHVARYISTIKRPFLAEAEEVEDAEDDEQLKRMQERWRFDADDVPTMSPSSPDEMGRVLLDDYSPRFLRHSMTFFPESDQQSLTNDPAIPVINNGEKYLEMPHRLALPLIHRLPPGGPRLRAPQRQLPTSIISAQHLKTMAPPLTHQMRISPNCGMRPSPVVSSPISGPPPQSNSTTALVCHSPSNKGIRRVAVNLPHTEPSSEEVAGRQTALNDNIKEHDCVVIPVRRQSLTANNSPISPAISQFSAEHSDNLVQPWMQGNHGLTTRQMFDLKAEFSSIQAKANQETNAAVQALPSYLQSGSANFALQQRLVAFAGSNTNLKLPATRQMQCASGALPSSKGLLSAGIGLESLIPGTISPSAVQAVSVPVSSPKEMRQILHIVPNGQLSLPTQPR